MTNVKPQQWRWEVVGACASSELFWVGFVRVPISRVTVVVTRLVWSPGPLDPLDPQSVLEKRSLNG